MFLSLFLFLAPEDVMMTAANSPSVDRVPASAQRTIRILDGISIFTGKAVSWLLIPMMLSLVYEVFMRYLFHSPTIWSMDMAVILFGINFMVGSAYCLQSGGHIRTDFFYNNWSVKTKAKVDILMYILLFFPVHIVFLEVLHHQRNNGFKPVDAYCLAVEVRHSVLRCTDAGAGRLGGDQEHLQVENRR